MPRNSRYGPPFTGTIHSIRKSTDSLWARITIDCESRQVGELGRRLNWSTLSGRFLELSPDVSSAYTSQESLDNPGGTPPPPYRPRSDDGQNAPIPIVSIRSEVPITNGTRPATGREIGPAQQPANISSVVGGRAPRATQGSLGVGTSSSSAITSQVEVRAPQKRPSPPPENKAKRTKLQPTDMPPIPDNNPDLKPNAIAQIWAFMSKFPKDLFPWIHKFPLKGACKPCRLNCAKWAVEGIGHDIQHCEEYNYDQRDARAVELGLCGACIWYHPGQSLVSYQKGECTDKQYFCLCCNGDKVLSFTAHEHCIAYCPLNKRFATLAERIAYMEGLLGRANHPPERRLGLAQHLQKLQDEKDKKDQQFRDALARAQALATASRPKNGHGTPSSAPQNPKGSDSDPSAQNLPPESLGSGQNSVPMDQNSSSADSGEQMEVGVPFSFKGTVASPGSSSPSVNELREKLLVTVAAASSANASEGQPSAASETAATAASSLPPSESTAGEKKPANQPSASLVDYCNNPETAKTIPEVVSALEGVIMEIDKVEAEIEAPQLPVVSAAIPADIPDVYRMECYPTFNIPKVKPEELQEIEFLWEETGLKITPRLSFQSELRHGVNFSCKTLWSVLLCRLKLLLNAGRLTFCWVIAKPLLHIAFRSKNLKQLLYWLVDWYNKVFEGRGSYHSVLTWFFWSAKIRMSHPDWDWMLQTFCNIPRGICPPNFFPLNSSHADTTYWHTPSTVPKTVKGKKNPMLGIRLHRQPGFAWFTVHEYTQVLCENLCLHIQSLVEQFPQITESVCGLIRRQGYVSPSQVQDIVDSADKEGQVVEDFRTFLAPLHTPELMEEYLAVISPLTLFSDSDAEEDGQAGRPITLGDMSDDDYEVVGRRDLPPDDRQSDSTSANTTSGSGDASKSLPQQRVITTRQSKGGRRRRK